MDIYTFYLHVLGFRPRDDTLNELPVDSPCGYDCARAIAAAKAMMQVTDPSSHHYIKYAIDDCVQVFWRG